MANPGGISAARKSLEHLLTAYSEIVHSHDAAIRTQAWNSINEDILAIDALRASLCVYRNACLIACRLPSEVLSYIFRCLVRIWPPHSRQRDLGWIKVTHVCRRWRDVACGDAALWVTAVVGFPLQGRWSAEMLSRTGSLPLRFEFVDHANPDRQSEVPLIKSLLKTHMYHIRDLHLEVIDAEPLADVSVALSAAAPCLETVILVSWCNNGSALPLDAFSTYAPRLRVLRLEGLTFHWNPNAFDTRNLEDLAICLANDLDDLPRPTMRTFTSFLSALSHLKELRLGDLPRSADDFRPTSPINLPRLTYLHIQGPVAECTAVLDVIEISPACTLSLGCDIHAPETATQFIPIFTRLNAHLRRESNLPPIQAFMLEAHDTPYLTLYGWREVSEDIKTPLDLETKDAAFIVKMFFISTDGTIQIDMRDLWRMIPASLPLQDTRFLSFHGFGVDNTYRLDIEHFNQGWTETLRSFSAVTHCYICAPLPGDSLDLSSALSRSISHNPLQPPLPSLVYLCVVSGPELTKAGYLLRSQWLEHQALLLEALDERKKNGFGIQELDLRNWAMEDDFEALLRSIVPRAELNDCKLIESIFVNEP